MEFLKQKVIGMIRAKLEERLSTIKLGLNSALQASVDETKSSAGDKYETSREMLQQDINRFQVQLKEAEKDEITLNRLLDNINTINGSVRKGNLVKTNKGIYFVGISIGAIKIDSHIVYGISAEAPIGKLLLGKSIGGRFVFNGVEQEVEAIF